ncbi:MAG: Tim44/TimA family putative adaptor protein [Proteobacteria bacterium]|nr:Tim44/TimA family putative adaptor protein [Pseudomonadota bacterium]
MGGDYIDVIIFAAIAAVLVFRLVSVLGKRTGEERSRDPFGLARGNDISQGGEKTPDNVVPLPSPDAAKTEAESETPLSAALAEIDLADKRFDQAEFLTGARSAFEMVITAYALGDLNTLKALLSEAVYANFSSAISQRERSGETQETTLVGVDSAEFLEANLVNSIAQITIKYLSQQITVTRDEAGAIIDGDPERINQITDIWTFSHDIRSKNPNWILVETRSSN